MSQVAEELLLELGGMSQRQQVKLEMLILTLD